MPLLLCGTKSKRWCKDSLVAYTETRDSILKSEPVVFIHSQRNSIAINPWLTTYTYSTRRCSRLYKSGWALIVNMTTLILTLISNESQNSVMYRNLSDFNKRCLSFLAQGYYCIHTYHDFVLYEECICSLPETPIALLTTKLVWHSTTNVA